MRACQLCTGRWTPSHEAHQFTDIVFNSSPRLPGEALKLPEGHNEHAPADDPPQPLRYRPAVHDAAEQEEQADDPGPDINSVS